MKHKNHNASASNQQEPDEVPNENRVKNGINKKIQSEAKRLQSLKHMIKGYQTQKSLIKAALSNVDSVAKNKIIFDDDDEPSEGNHTESKKPSLDLFGSEDDASDVDDLKVDEKFESATTKQIWDLQKKFQNDERFKLTKKSFFKDQEGDKEPPNSAEGDSLEDEKQKQFQILEQVLGTKVTSKNKNESSVQAKGMSRFDPSQPESKNYEIDNIKLANESTDEVAKKKKKKEKTQKEVEIVKPVVSKVIFHKVDEDLNFTGGAQQFSLLSAFGVADEQREEKKPYQADIKERSSSSSSSGHEKNPFRYDSSSDEEKEGIKQSEHVEIEKNRVAAGAGQSVTLLSEPFFFQDDDYRLQEGLDFMKRFEAEEPQEFGKLRRDLKKIVKAKVKNNQRKDKPFKKKLGGNKRKKMIKVKKALKR